MEIFDLYGLMNDNLEEACLLVEEALNIKLEPREGLHRGDYYGRGLGYNEEKIILQRNFDPFYEEIIEEEFPDVPILLYITTKSVGRAREIERILKGKIPGVRHLRQSVWEK